MRALHIDSGLGFEEWAYLYNHARRLGNLAPARDDASMSRYEAFLHHKPELVSTRKIGGLVLVKLFPKPTALRPRGLIGHWYGLAGEGHSVHLVKAISPKELRVGYLAYPTGCLKHFPVGSMTPGVMDTLGCFRQPVGYAR